jgi:type IV pilus assembly protein PilA
MNEATAKKKGLPTWAIVLIVVAVAGPFVIGTLAAFAIYGVRKYVAEAKRQEAVQMLTTWSQGMIGCGEREGRLPPSSRPVPATLDQVSGKKYQSGAADWVDTAYTCASFNLRDPQYFQYQWEQTSDTEGVMRAVADLDADGRADQAFEARVTCSAGRCTASAATKL